MLPDAWQCCERSAQVISHPLAPGNEEPWAWCFPQAGLSESEWETFKPGDVGYYGRAWVHATDRMLPATSNRAPTEKQLPSRELCCNCLRATLLGTPGFPPRAMGMANHDPTHGTDEAGSRSVATGPHSSGGHRKPRGGKRGNSRGLVVPRGWGAPCLLQGDVIGRKGNPPLRDQQELRPAPQGGLLPGDLIRGSRVGRGTCRWARGGRPDFTRRQGST